MWLPRTRSAPAQAAGAGAHLIELDPQQRRTLIWAGLAVTLSAFNGSVLILALPAVANDFGAAVPAIANLGSVLAFGAIGALPLSALADKVGRRRLIAVGIAGFSAANFLNAFVPSLMALAGLRLVAVCFEVTVAGVASALIVEEAPAIHRGLAVSALAVFGGFGAGITVFAYPLIAPHWRWLFEVGGVGLAAAPLVWKFLPEGKTWQGVTPADSTVRLLWTRPWRFRLVVLTAVTAIGSVLVEPAGLLFTLFASRDLHMGPAPISALIVASAVAGFLSYLAGGFFTDRYGRRRPAFWLVAAEYVGAAGSFVTGTIGFFAGNVLWSAAASAATPVFGAWDGELYPTRARATAVSINSIAAAVGGITGLQLVGLLAPRIGLGDAIGVLGLAVLLSAGLFLLLPETKGQPLPE